MSASRCFRPRSLSRGRDSTLRGITRRDGGTGGGDGGAENRETHLRSRLRAEGSPGGCVGRIGERRPISVGGDTRSPRRGDQTRDTAILCPSPPLGPRPQHRLDAASKTQGHASNKRPENFCSGNRAHHSPSPPRDRGATARGGNRALPCLAHRLSWTKGGLPTAANWRATIPPFPPEWLATCPRKQGPRLSQHRPRHVARYRGRHRDEIVRLYVRRTRCAFWARSQSALHQGDWRRTSQSRTNHPAARRLKVCGRSPKIPPPDLWAHGKPGASPSARKHDSYSRVRWVKPQG